MRVLVVGGGGREHALAAAIAASPLVLEVHAAPGNPGIALVAKCHPVRADDVEGQVALARALGAGLVVVGPEAPLVLGLADRLREAGVPVFGPSADAARVEGSKAFAKELLVAAGVDTAQALTATSQVEARAAIRQLGGRCVVKADGLAAGKGVILCRNENEAYAAIDHMMIEGAFGESGAEVVIEEFMEGEEASFFALVDGERALPLVGAQDHKAAHDGDEGPNTGGMGAYTPAPVLDDKLIKDVMARIVEPTIHGMAAEGTPFQGVLYAGLMITKAGPKLIEYNCRFGDPECQPMMMRLKSDALELLLAAAEGRLDKVKLEWHADAALSVVMAAKGYPGNYDKGSEIKGLDAAGEVDGVVVFHAGTKREADGRITARGGRVLNVTALAKTVKDAQKKAYEAVDRIEWPEGFCRRDIGWRAIKR